jgi:hypothetical protein
LNSTQNGHGSPSGNHRKASERAAAFLGSKFSGTTLELAEALAQAGFRLPDTNGHSANGNGRVVDLRDWTDLEVQALPPLDYFIRPVLPKGALVGLAAPSGSAKTFLAIDWAFTLAHRDGLRVLMTPLEGYNTHASRIMAWKIHHGLDPSVSIPGVVYRPPGYRLDLAESKSVGELAEHVHTTGPYDLLIVDNLNEALRGDDSDPALIAAGMAGLRQLHAALGLDKSVVMLDNFGHQSNRLRGSSKKIDTLDTIVYVKRVHDDGTEVTAEEDDPLERVKVWCGKERNGPKFGKFFLRFQPVDVGGGQESGVLVPMDKPRDPVLQALAGGGSFTVADLVATTGKSRPTISKRLKYWVEQEVVTEIPPPRGAQGGGLAKRYELVGVMAWAD